MPEKPAPPPLAIRLFRLSVFAIVSTALALLLMIALVAAIFAYAVVHTPCQGDLASLSELGYPSEAVEFTSDDGSVRHGWYSEGAHHPEIAIIVQPGHAGNTRYALGDAVIFAEAGYSTLIFEHRSCADPNNIAGTGMLEADDVLGAVDYLDSRPDVEHIAAMGFSAGGSAIVVAAGQDERIEALIAVGGYTSLAEDTLDPDLTNQHPAEWLYRRFMWWSFIALIGPNKLNPAPIDLVDQIAPRPIFLIYGDAEARVGNILYAAAGDPKSIWIVPNATHGTYAQAAPDDYPQKMVEFMDSVFAITRANSE